MRITKRFLQSTFRYYGTFQLDAFIYFYTVDAHNTCKRGEHLTWEDVARSFLVRCALQAAKRTN